MPINPYEGMSNEELRARIAKTKAETGVPTEQQKRNEAVLQQAQNAVVQSTQRNVDLARQLSQYRQRSEQDKQKIAAKRAETAKFKTGLAAQTASQVQAIESGAAEPGSSEWDTIVQGAISAAKGVRPAKAVVPVASTKSSYSWNDMFTEETVKLAVKESKMEQNKPYFNTPGWPQASKEQRQHRIDTANRNAIMKDAAVYGIPAAVGGAFGGLAVGTGSLLGSGLAGGIGAGSIAGTAYSVARSSGHGGPETGINPQTGYPAGKHKYNEPEVPRWSMPNTENLIADTGAEQGERQRVIDRQKAETSSPEYLRRRKEHQAAIDAANAEAKARGISTQQLKEVKEMVKESIIHNFMENAKPEFARRGAGKQRPKSWDKGTKSGSEKRKMREQGKREAQQMNEDWEDDESGPQERLIRSGRVSPDTSYYRGNRRGEYRSYTGQSDTQAAWARQNIIPLLKKHGMEEHAGSIDERGYPSSAAMTHPNFAAFARDFIDLHTQHNRQHWATENRASPYHWPAIKQATIDLKNQDGPMEESTEYKLRKALAENQNWVPPETNEFGAEADDMMLRADEEADREKDLAASKKLSHADVIERLNQAHETALSRIATSYGKGGKHAKLDPYYMLGHYMEHLEDLHNPIRGDLT